LKIESDARNMRNMRELKKIPYFQEKILENYWKILWKNLP